MPRISKAEFNQIVVDELPWAADTGLTLEKIEAGQVLMRLPYDNRSVRPGGTISGPHMMLLSDACMYAVVLSLIGKVKLAVTTNFNINFLRKPAESDLLAEGRSIKLGKRLAVLEVSVFTEAENELVAHATGTYSIPPESQMD
ncbi:MAG: PaaI family thioesterase [Gammaproteobacteria bacterium]|nr:PaaI family thioesterase [Gammaproteobacteria bacterium]